MASSYGRKGGQVRKWLGARGWLFNVFGVLVYFLHSKLDISTMA